MVRIVCDKKSVLKFCVHYARKILNVSNQRIAEEKKTHTHKNSQSVCVCVCVCATTKQVRVRPKMEHITYAFQHEKQKRFSIGERQKHK